MRIFTKTLLCTASLLIFLPSQAWAQTQIGINAAVKGDVKISSGDTEAAQAEVRSPVLLGDGVTSQTESSLQVLLNDETTFTVGPDCELVIDEFVYDPSRAGNNSLKASVKKGMFRFMSGNISKGNTTGVTVDSPVATMGVRGTIVEGLVGKDAIRMAEASGVDVSGMTLDEDGASLFVLRGPGAKTRGSVRRGEIDVTSNGKTVKVTRSGWATFVGSNSAAPSDPFPLPDSVYEFMSDRLRTKATSNAPDDTNVFLGNGGDINNVIGALDLSTADIGLLESPDSGCIDYFVTEDFFDFDMLVLNGGLQSPDGNFIEVNIDDPATSSITEGGAFLPSGIFLGSIVPPAMDGSMGLEGTTGFNNIGIFVGQFCNGTEPFSPVPPNTPPPTPVPGLPFKPGG